MRMPSPLPVIVASIVASYAFTQGNLRSRLQVITAPTRNAGVYHVATGTWTRNASIGNLTGEVTIYNNSCAAVYFVRLDSVETYAHRSRIPSPSGETAVSLYYGTTNPDHRWDERPGCSVNYLVTGFEVAYCSSSTATIDWEYAFASSYTQCADADMVPQYTFLLTGLPGGTPTGAQNCWTIDVDISGTTPAMVLSADGDGTYDPANKSLQQFGFRFQAKSPTTLADYTGPIVAGDFSWTGGPGTTAGVLTPCTGTDGTWWDNPLNMAEEGTGMNSNDFFRITGIQAGPTGAGCYFFGHHPHGDFWLKLFAKTSCPAPDPMTGFCYPNVSGVRSCPCGNQQSPDLSAKGCNNFGPIPAGGTRGSTLFASGLPVAATTCDVQFHVMHEQGTPNITILFMGDSTLAAGVASGAGVRCVGTLQIPRPYKRSSTVVGTESRVDFGLGVGTDQDAWTRSGMPVAATKNYYAAYRNSAAGDGTHPPCTPVDAFNLTNAGYIVWP